MICKILINAVDTEECRIATVKDSKLEGFHIESATREVIHGNIYKGEVARVEPALQAAAGELVGDRHDPGVLLERDRDAGLQPRLVRGGHLLAQPGPDLAELLLGVAQGHRARGPVGVGRRVVSGHVVVRLPRTCGRSDDLTTGWPVLHSVVHKL